MSVRFSPLKPLVVSLSLLAGCALDDAKRQQVMGRKTPPSGVPISSAKVIQPKSAEAAVPGSQSKKVSVEDCILFALQHNFAVRMATASERSAAAQLVQAKAVFDPTVGGTVVSSRPEGQGWSSATASGGIAQKLPSGADIRVEAVDVYRRTGDFRDDYLSGGGTSDLTLSITQPLLQGAWGVNRSGIQLAGLLKEQASATRTAEVLEMLRAAEAAYWSAATAEERLERQRHSMQRAQKLHADVKARLEAGEASQLDLLEADVALAGAQERLVAAQRAKEDLMDDLWFVLGVPVNLRQSGIALSDAGEKAIITEKPDPEASIARALTLAPTSVLLVNEVHRREIELAKARNNLLPRVDLEMNVDHFSGATTTSASGANPGSASGFDAVALMRVSLPLTLRAERAGLEKAKAEMDRSQAGREQAELRLRQRVSELCRALDSGHESLRASKVSLLANQKKLEEQMRRHAEGLLSTHDLRLAQEEMEAAEVRELQARLALLGDQVSLGQLEGTLAARHGLTL